MEEMLTFLSLTGELLTIVGLGRRHSFTGSSMNILNFLVFQIRVRLLLQERKVCTGFPFFLLRFLWFGGGRGGSSAEFPFMYKSRRRPSCILAVSTVRRDIFLSLTVSGVIRKLSIHQFVALNSERCVHPV